MTDISDLLASERGLSDAEAARRLSAEGYNELPSQKKQTVFDIILNVLKEPMLLLLLGCGGIYLVLGAMKDAMPASTGEPAFSFCLESLMKTLKPFAASRRAQAAPETPQPRTQALAPL